MRAVKKPIGLSEDPIGHVPRESAALIQHIVPVRPVCHVNSVPGFPRRSTPTKPRTDVFAILLYFKDLCCTQHEANTLLSTPAPSRTPHARFHQIQQIFGVRSVFKDDANLSLGHLDNRSC